MARSNHNDNVLIKIENLKQFFPIKTKFGNKKEKLYVRANDNVSVNIYEGETLGIVGESGCGKSTLGRTLLQLYEQTDGRTMYYGKDIYQVRPSYIHNTLSNAKKLKDKFFSSKQALEEEVKKLSSMKPEDSNYINQSQKVFELNISFNKQLYKLAQVLGGFMVADDISRPLELLSKEYELGCKLNKDPKDTKIAQELEKTRDDIDTELAKYKDKPGFDFYENYRDNGINLIYLDYEEMRKLRVDLQLIFQDPYSSLNPRMTVGQIISEGLFAHNIFKQGDEKIDDYIIDVMDECGLAPYFVHRYPHQFSGGQRQRIGIARSVALQPKFIICDEAVSALDVSIQSQIINLLLDLKKKSKLTYMFISHDLSVIKYISDRVAVMYLGNIIELAGTEELFNHPRHPYTEALLSAIPTTDVENKKEIKILEGDIPSPIKPPKGCKFHTRCKYATDICKEVEPKFEETRPGHFVACHHVLTY